MGTRDWDGTWREGGREGGWRETELLTMDLHHVHT